MKKKYGVVYRFSNEMLHELLGLPEGTKLKTVWTDPERDVSSIKLTSDELIEGVTFEVPEGHLYPSKEVEFDEEGVALDALEMADMICEDADDGYEYALDLLEKYNRRQMKEEGEC